MMGDADKITSSEELRRLNYAAALHGELYVPTSFNSAVAEVYALPNLLFTSSLRPVISPVLRPGGAPSCV